MSEVGGNEANLAISGITSGPLFLLLLPKHTRPHPRARICAHAKHNNTNPSSLPPSSTAPQVDAETAAKIDEFCGRLAACAAAEQPFTLILDDPAGNSFIER